jgi:hypothetical protein
MKPGWSPCGAHLFPGKKRRAALDLSDTPWHNHRGSPNQGSISSSLHPHHLFGLPNPGVESHPGPAASGARLGSPTWLFADLDFYSIAWAQKQDVLIR